MYVMYGMSLCSFQNFGGHSNCSSTKKNAVGKLQRGSVPKQGFALLGTQSRENTYLSITRPCREFEAGCWSRQHPAESTRDWCATTTRCGQYFTDLLQRPSRKRNSLQPLAKLCAGCSIALNVYLTYHTASHYRKSLKSTRPK